MIINKIGQRGTLFTYSGKDYPAAGDISLYLIDAGDEVFICDTHLGPRSMEDINQYISQHLGGKKVIVFNSHSDWDHIWGNSAFGDSTIIGHEKCRKRITERGQFDLERFSQYQNGPVQLKLPTLTFESRMTFEDAGIEFIYAPGHTIDSAICFDRKDSVLFVGDLVEYPIPYLSHNDLEAYIASLELIKSKGARTIISSHSGIVDERLIDSNLAYLRNIHTSNPVEFLDSEDFSSIHDYNMKNQLLLKYEDIVRQKLDKSFDYKNFRSSFPNLNSISYEDLEDSLKEYIQNI